MTAYFPSELPERPQKQGLTKRLTQKLILKTVKQKKPTTISEPIPLHVLPPAFGPSVRSATNLSSPPAFQRLQTVPASFGFGAGSGQEASAIETHTVPAAPPTSPILQYKSPVPHHPNNSHGPIHTAPSFERPRPPPLPAHVRQKQLPASPFGRLHSDPLVQRFERLRLSQGRTAHGMRVQSTTVPTSTIPVNYANFMAAPNQAPPTLRRQSQLLPRRQTAPPPREPPVAGSTANWPIVIDDECGKEAKGTPERSAQAFSQINYFQSHPSRPSNFRYRNNPFESRNRRRSRSPSTYSTSSSSSEDDLLPGRSNVSYPDLTAQVVLAENSGRVVHSPTVHPSLQDADDLAFQEEQDRQLAQKMQREEDKMLIEPQSAVSNTAAPFSNLTQALQPQGTQEDPIDIDEDLYGWVDAFYGGPMEVDDSNQAIHETLHRLTNQTVEKDLEVARALQAEEDEDQEAPGNRKCVVCTESYAIVDLPSLANCAHRPETCADCFAQWIAAQLRDSGWTEVKCPGNGCKVLLAYFEIQQYAAEEVFQQYDAFLARAAFSEDPNFRWCRNCTSGQIHLTGVEGPIFTCVNCERKVCVVHENTWHEGETCEEYEYRASGQKDRDQRAQEKASLKAIGKLSKKCPGPNCHYNIEKNEGCDHITCSKCRYEFCWICLCDYNAVRREGNAAHSRDCKYHSERLR